MIAPVPHADRQVAQAAVARAVLLGRSAATLTAAAVGLRLATDPAPQVAVMALVAAATCIAIAALARDPGVVVHAAPILALDAAVVLVILIVGRGEVATFWYAAGASALAGVLIGQWAIALAAVYTAVGYATASAILEPDVSPTVAGFVLAYPIANVLAAVGAGVITSAVARYVDLSVKVVASAQRTAAASERARLARELHDSVSKTLRGVSFAALALPSSLRRHPALAEQLAETVSHGAAVAAQQAREVVEGLRLDVSGRQLGEAVTQICRDWSQRSAIPVRVTTEPVETNIHMRYELSQILHEALENVARHAGARQVIVELTSAQGVLRLRVEDDGRGFRVPAGWERTGVTDRLGLVGMAERAAAVEGALRLRSAPGRGTVVEAEVPLRYAVEAVS